MWLLYGANGTSGRLLLDIWQKAWPNLPPPFLAGRDPIALRALSEQYGLPYGVFSLTQLASTALPSELRLIVNFAGPYAHTAAPWLAFCRERGLAYLDICGEWPVLQTHYEAEATYRQTQVPVILGAGYDTVAGEASLYFFRQRYPAARKLHLGIYAQGGFSAGTVQSALQTLPHRYRHWEGGQLRLSPFQSLSRPLPTGQTRTFWKATLAELLTYPAWNIDLQQLTTWVALPRRYMRWLPLLEKVFAWMPFQTKLQELIRSRRPQLAKQMDLSAQCYTFVEADETPERLYVRTPQAYVFTAWAVLQSVQLFLAEGTQPGVQSAFARWRERLWQALPGTALLWQGR